MRAWADGVHLDIWDYYDHFCFKPFTDELRKPENKPLLDWARPLAKADNQIEDAVVQAKKDFAQQIAVASGMEYRILKSSDADKRHFRVLL